MGNPLTGGTAADVRLLRNLAVLAKCLPKAKRAEHLTPDCEDLAGRIEAGLQEREEVSL